MYPTLNKPYLVKTVPDEEYTDGIVFIEELTDAAEKDFDPFFEEAQEEN